MVPSGQSTQQLAKLVIHPSDPSNQPIINQLPVDTFDDYNTNKSLCNLPPMLSLPTPNVCMCVCVCVCGGGGGGCGHKSSKTSATESCKIDQISSQSSFASVSSVCCLERMFHWKCMHVLYYSFKITFPKFCVLTLFQNAGSRQLSPPTPPTICRNHTPDSP